MQTSIELLEALRISGIRFLRDPSRRALHGVVPSWSWGTAIDIVTGLGQRPEAKGPLLRVDGRGREDADPWVGCGLDVREGYGAWHEALGSELGWAELPEVPARGGFVGFVEQLGQVVLARPHDGAEVIVVLLLEPSSAQTRWGPVLTAMMNSGPLRAVRWVVIEQGASVLDVGGVVDRHALVVRPSPAGVEPPKMGATSPKSDGLGRGAEPHGVAAPRRPRSSAAALAEGDPRSGAMVRHVLAAGDASSDGRKVDAVEQQCRARDRAVDGGDPRSTIAMELVLGGHLLAAGATSQADSSYERAVVLAKEGDDTELEIVALLALGSCRLVQDDRPAALVVFANAAARAEEAGSSALTIEACRITGDVAEQLGMEGQAIVFWSRAIKRGRKDPAMASSSAVVRCVQALDSLCTRRGLQAHAARLLEETMESRADVGAPDSVDEANAVEPAGAQQPEGTMVLRDWSDDERESLTRSTRSLLDEEATSLLTPEELASLHGWAELPAPRDGLSYTVVLSAGLDGRDHELLLDSETQWIDPGELEKIRRGL